MDLKLKLRKEKIENERKRERVREQERERERVREKKIKRAMLENKEEMILFNSLFFTKIIIPTMIDRDCKRERQSDG